MNDGRFVMMMCGQNFGSDEEFSERGEVNFLVVLLRKGILSWVLKKETAILLVFQKNYCSVYIQNLDPMKSFQQD